MIKVDFGKWKFVIKPSIALNSYPGYIKISVQPLSAMNLSFLLRIVSNVLVEVVPTEIIFLPSAFTLFNN